MPWTTTDYPNSMKNLPVKVREKAIEIANALLDEKSMEEGIVIATAISRAKDWAANRGLTVEKSGNKSSTDAKQHGEDRYVIPFTGHMWAVKEEGEVKVEKVFKSKAKAIKLASTEAKQSKTAITIQNKEGKIEKRISYNPHKKRSAKKSTKTAKKS